MHIIKLDATDSTNLYLKNLMLSDSLEDLTVVVTREQRKGRGQIGASWQSTKGKNLTFSLLKKLDAFFIQNQFYLNMAVSLAIYDTLKAYHLPELKIKWPNDILSGAEKICGILIENVTKGQRIRASIIGIGLNVNETDFPNLFNATSLKLLLGRNLNLDELLEGLLERLEYYFNRLESGEMNPLKESYLKVLFRINEASRFKTANNEEVIGTITGVSNNGRLQVFLENDRVQEFDLKEVQLLY